MEEGGEGKERKYTERPYLVLFDLNGVLGERRKRKFTPTPGMAAMLGALVRADICRVGIWSSGSAVTVADNVASLISAGSSGSVAADPDAVVVPAPLPPFTRDELTVVLSRDDVGGEHLKPFDKVPAELRARYHVVLVDDSFGKTATWPRHRVLVVKPRCPTASDLFDRVRAVLKK